MLSHQAAASLWDLMPHPRIIDITTRAESRSMPGIRVHRGGTDNTTVVDGLPLTSPTWTLLDLAPVLTEHRLERISHRAEQLRLLDMRELETFDGRRGVVKLRRAVATLTLEEPNITRNDLEERFLSLVDSANLPKPRTNARVLDYEVDFLWPDHRLIVETDGRETHFTLTAFERDRERDAALTAVGYRVVRFTWRQVIHDPERVAKTLRELLSGAR